MSNTIKNIADLIVEEARNRDNNDLIGSILNIHSLVMIELMKRKNDIWRAEKAKRLKKEIVGE